MIPELVIEMVNALYFEIDGDDLLVEEETEPGRAYWVLRWFGPPLTFFNFVRYQGD